MENSITVTGESVRAAIDAGLAKLGILESEAEIKIVNKPSGGFLSIGKKMAKIEISKRGASMSVDRTGKDLSYTMGVILPEEFASSVAGFVKNLNPYTHIFTLTAALVIGKLNNNNNHFEIDILVEDLQLFAQHFSKRNCIDDVCSKKALEKLVEETVYKRFPQYKEPIVEMRNGETVEYRVNVDSFIEKIVNTQDLWCILANFSLLNQFGIFDDTDEQLHSIKNNVSKSEEIFYNMSQFGTYITLLCSFCNMGLIYKYAQCLKDTQPLYQAGLDAVSDGVDVAYPELYAQYKLSHFDIFPEEISEAAFSLVVNVALLSDNYHYSIEKAEDELGEIGISVKELVSLTFDNQRKIESPYHSMLQQLEKPEWSSLFNSPKYDEYSNYLVCATNYYFFKKLSFDDWILELVESLGAKQEIDRRAE